MSCLTTQSVHVTSSCGSFNADARVTVGPTKMASSLPYSTQKGKFRLFTVEYVPVGAVINSTWRVTSVEEFAGRRFCECVRIHLRNEVTVELVELLKIQGPSARTQPETRHANVKAGMSVASKRSRVDDELRFEDGDILFCLCEGTDDLIAGRWQVVHDNRHYKVLRIVDNGRPDRAPVVVCQPDDRRS